MPDALYQVRIAQGDPSALIDLRALEGALDAIERTMGVALPRRVGQCVTSAEASVLTLGPYHWLIRTIIERESACASALEQAIGPERGAATIVSDAFVCVRLTGEDAALVLAQGTPLDLHPTRFPIGSCARSVLARASVLIVRDSGGFEVLADRSYADYVARWLALAAAGRRGP